MMNDWKVIGGGAFCSLLETLSGWKPDVVVGKPNTSLFEWVQQEKHIDLSRTVMIGDKLDTDVLFGHWCGIDTILVETGCH